MWLDALTNYLTILGMESAEKNVSGYVHFVGKDIAKFHCIYWPSFLMALYGKETLPNKVFNHGHWLKDGYKMSKSLGNVVDPNTILDIYGSDTVRLYFLGQGPLRKDMDFSDTLLMNTHNNFFIDSYMNLIFRIMGKKIIQNIDTKNIKLLPGNDPDQLIRI